ncbi:unnamed protein product [Durusdinium trenchii]|uniref:Condensin complex subunit 2 n=1 Tax=Durusdinium trenchii TaxID=1381693 RepID=A0ABP0JRZ1_9DINO
MPAAIPSDPGSPAAKTGRRRDQAKRPLEAEATPARCRRRTEADEPHQAGRATPVPFHVPDSKAVTTEPLSPKKEAQIRTAGVEFELAYSEDWVDVFDKKLEQALCEIEEASIPQEELVAFSLTIMDAFGSTLVCLDSRELETSGLPTRGLFSGSQPGVSAHFPLKVRLGPSSSGIGGGANSVHGKGPKAELPISPASLLEQFRRNLCRKPLRLGGPVSLARIEELCELLEIGEGSPSQGIDGGFSVNFVPVVLQAGTPSR